MNRVSINEAEAILEPFWDGGTGDWQDKNIRYAVFNNYAVTQHKDIEIDFVQSWAFVNFLVKKISLDEKASLVMQRSCEMDISAYDNFIVFASFPKNVCFSLFLKVDGAWQTLFERERGEGVAYEYKAPYSGKVLEGIKLEMFFETVGAQGNIGWFGVAHEDTLQRMLNRKNVYDNTWPGYFKEESVLKPDIGLLFDKNELDELRKKCKEEPFKKAYLAKKKKAYKEKTIVPEDYIGRFAPFFDRRWCRTRDAEFALDLNKGASGMHEVIENLAFVGIMEQDEDMMRMACRHAFSVAHCEYWSESFIGHFPGATWHHRSFTETVFCKAISLVLDWCGGMMTDFAKQVLFDALAKKGLPQIQSDFRRVEYIRHMNQGPAFAYGKVYALAALKTWYPRYDKDLQETEDDLISMVDLYVNSDGGTTEGPGYWVFTFKEVVSAFYLLSREKKVPFTSYKHVFEKTGEFALAHLSMEQDATVSLAINDCHPLQKIPCSLANSFAQFTSNAQWQALYAKLLKQEDTELDAFAIISGLEANGAPYDEFAINRLYPVTGLVAAVRKGEFAKTRVMLCSGDTCPTHFHEDRGSIILEANDKMLCPDCGSGFYFEAELFWLHSANAHSLLCPLDANSAAFAQGRYEKGGVITKAIHEGDLAHFISYDTLAWSGEPCKYISREVYSPFAELVIIKDEYELKNAKSVRFQLNAMGEWQTAKNSATAIIEDVKLRVVPLNWSAEFDVFAMQDGEHRSVWQLRAENKMKKAVLYTAILIETTVQTDIQKTAEGWHFKLGEKEVYIKNDT